MESEDILLYERKKQLVMPQEDLSYLIIMLWYPLNADPGADLERITQKAALFRLFPQLDLKNKCL